MKKEISKKRRKRIRQLRIRISITFLFLFVCVFFLIRQDIASSLFYKVREMFIHIEYFSETDEGAEDQKKESGESSDTANGKQEADNTGEGNTDTARKEETTEENKESSIEAEAHDNKTAAQNIKEEGIYTFLQGPKAWGSKAPWSGEWCQSNLTGSLFSVYGCGLCDLANIYSTLSPYECSPIDMFYFARDNTEYSPSAGVGAIDWPYLEKALNLTGFTCELGNKEDTYEAFQKKMVASLTAIVLVSSVNDATYWKNTEGHYVNIWAYNPEKDEVFLADSGDPDHNRNWIPLKYVYDALKTTGSYQYLLVTDYNEEQNTWKHCAIEENWTIPDYYISKSGDTSQDTKGMNP